MPKSRKGNYCKVPVLAAQIPFTCNRSRRRYWPSLASTCFLIRSCNLCMRSAAEGPSPGRSVVRASHLATPAASLASSRHFRSVASLALLALPSGAGAGRFLGGLPPSTTSAGVQSGGGFRGLATLGGGAESRTTCW